MKWKDRGLRPAAVGLGALALLIVAYLIFAPSNSDGSRSPSDSEIGESTLPSDEPAGSTDSEGTVATDQPLPTDTAGAPTETAASTQPSVTAEPYAPSATSTPPGLKNLVHIAIAAYNGEAQTIEVSAGAPGIATDGGTCTLTASNGAATMTMQQSAVFDGHGASCGLMSLSVAGQPAGSWQISVSFTSTQGDAVSETQTVEVA